MDENVVRCYSLSIKNIFNAINRVADENVAIMYWSMGEGLKKLYYLYFCITIVRQTTVVNMKINLEKVIEREGPAFASNFNARDA